MKNLAYPFIIFLLFDNCQSHYSNKINTKGILDTKGYLDVTNNRFENFLIAANDGINADVEEFRQLAREYKSKASLDGLDIISNRIQNRYNLVARTHKSHTYYIDCDTHYFRTPLMWACLSGQKEDLESLVYLLHSKVFLNKKRIIKSSKDILGETALHYAVYKNHFVFVELLIQDPKIKIDQVDSKKHSPLHLACYQGNINIIELLINHNADVNKFSKSGKDMIYMACWAYKRFSDRNFINRTRMSEDSIMYLLSLEQLKLSNIDKTLFDAVHFRCSPTVIKKLFELGATASYLDKNQNGIFHDLCLQVRQDEFSEKQSTLEIFYTILESQKELQDIDHKNKDDITALFLAIQHEKYYLAKALIENGADVNLCCQKGYAYPIHLLATKRSIVSIQSLLVLMKDKELDVNCQNSYSVTPLIWAIQLKNKPLIEWFLENGADYKLLSKNGNSVLHHTALSGDQTLLKEFISKGLDVNLANNKKETPLDHCEADETISLLKEYGAKNGKELTSGRCTGCMIL